MNQLAPSSTPIHSNMWVGRDPTNRELSAEFDNVYRLVRTPLAPVVINGAVTFGEEHFDRLLVMMDNSSLTLGADASLGREVKVIWNTDRNPQAEDPEGEGTFYPMLYSAGGARFYTSPAFSSDTSVITSPWALRRLTRVTDSLWVFG